MLVLTRKVGERVVIGDVQVDVLRIKGNRVTIGVTAVRSVPVHRGEVAERIVAERIKERGREAA